MDKFTLTVAIILTAIFGNIAQAAESTSQNYFVEGATWIYKSSTTSYPTIPGTTHKLWLEAEQEIAGYKAMPMWGVQIAADKEVDDGKEHTPAIWTYLRTDGAKVYFLADEETSEWGLLYNFDIKPGDPLSFNSKENWSSSEIENYNTKCSVVEPMTDNPELTLIKLKDDRDTTDGEGSIEWLAGIGNIAGPLYNWYSTDIVGWGCTLLEMSVGDRIIYRSSGYTGVEEVRDSYGAAISVENGTILASDPSDTGITAYDISGKAYHAADGKLTQLPTGTYIVLVNGSRHKVMVP